MTRKIRKAIEAIPFAKVNRPNLHPTENQDSSIFTETQELLILLISAPKRPDLYVFVRYFY